MNRRQFCGHAGWTAVTVGGIGLSVLGTGAARAGSATPASSPLDDVHRKLLEALPSRTHAVSIGKAHLAATGERPSARDLTADLTAAIEMSADEIGRCTTSDLRAAFKASNAADFAGNRTVRVGGWILGETEMRLFCLAALA